MNTLTVNDWRDLTSGLNLMLGAIWMVTLLGMAIVGVIAQVAPPMPAVIFRLRVPVVLMHYFWLWLMPIAVLLRLPMMFQSAWYDETFTGVMSSLPIDRFAIALQGDVHPPGYYLLAAVSSVFLGHNDFAIRLPALIGGILLIPAMYRLTLALTRDTNVSRLAAGITALLPAMIHYSNEARYPSLLALMVIVALVGILEDRPVWWCVAVACLPLLHAVGLIYAALLVLVALPHYLSWRLWRWIPATIPVVLVAAACLWLMSQQAQDVADGFWLLPILPLTHITEGTVLLPPSPFDILTYSCVIVLTVMGYWALIKTAWFSLLVTVIAIVVPVLLFAVSALWHPVYLPRSLLASVLILVPGWALLVRKHWFYQVMLCAMLVISIPAMYARREGVELRDLMSHCAGADLVVTTSTSMNIVAKHYVPAGARVLSYVGGNSINQTLDTEARNAMGFDFTPVELLTGQVCMVVQWNAYTTDSEKNRISDLKFKYAPAVATFRANQFVVYEVMRWSND